MRNASSMIPHEKGPTSADLSEGRDAVYVGSLPTYCWVTVAHSPVFPLLQLQARSFALYMDPSLATEIIVIDNSKKGSKLDQEALACAYGPLANRVRVIRNDEILSMSFEGLDGWFTQQALKLLVARRTCADRIILLDDKNHLVFPLVRDSLESNTGKIRFAIQIIDGHPLQPYLQSACRYFDLDPALHKWFVPPVTPFPADVRIMREMLDWVETRECRSFEEAFLRPRGEALTEFFLYGAYLVHSGRAFADVYDLSSQYHEVVWDYRGVTNLDRIIRNSIKSTAPFFSVHSRVFPKLEPVARRLLANYWHQRGLFHTPELAHEFLEKSAMSFIS